jgi:hypothetical protein
LNRERSFTIQGLTPIHGFRQSWPEEEGRRLRLTDEGLLFADEIFLRLF